MTDDPNQPFQPPGGSGQPWQPGQPGQGPAPAGESTSASAIGGVMIGLGLGLLGPALIGGVLAAVLTSANAGDGVSFLVSNFGGIGGTVAIYLLFITKLDKTSPKQDAMRTAIVVTGWISLALYAVGLLLIGVCFALLAGAY